MLAFKTDEIEHVAHVRKVQHGLHILDIVWFSIQLDDLLRDSDCNLLPASHALAERGDMSRKYTFRMVISIKIAYTIHLIVSLDDFFLGCVFGRIVSTST